MKMGGHIGYCSALILMTGISCRKPYLPPIVAASNNYLVVEGAINAGQDSTFVKLSRTVRLSDKTTINAETGASVTVQSDQNVSYPLTEISRGNYACAGLNLDNTHKYRLSINTTSNEQYLSDYVEVLNAPPIDSVSYDTKGTTSSSGLNVYVTTHDPSNKVHYFRWDYQETWEFSANFPSYYYSNGDTVLQRNLVTDNITDCWSSDTSSTIVIGSSAKLSQDIIYNFPVIAIPSTSEKVEIEYSIRVTQYALTPDAYTFYSELKKNTEQLGSIFDAQPSEITGNIHCANHPSQPVLGYISIGTTSTQRIFVISTKLPDWKTIPFYSDCILAFGPDNPCCYYVYPPGPIDQVAAYINYNTNNNHDPLIPVNAIVLRPNTPPIGYTASYRRCVDCTLRGSNKKPGFWQ